MWLPRRASLRVTEGKLCLRHSSHASRRLAPRSRQCRVHSSQQESQGNSQGSSASNCAEAQEALNHLFSALKLQTNGSELLDWIPDVALDELIEARKQAGLSITSLTIHDLCEHYHSSQNGAHFSIDSMAQRLLLWDNPSQVSALSAISLGAEKSAHRFLLMSSCGEEVLLTVVVEKQETLQPQYRSSPRIERTWRLRSLSGEPTQEALDVMGPSPCVGPELVVAVQMAALREGDFGRVYKFTSPESQAVTLDKFESMFKGSQFRPLLGKCEQNTLRRAQYARDAYFELVAVTISAAGEDEHGKTSADVQQHWLYLWDVQRQPVIGEEGVPTPWLMQSVQMVSATNTVYRPGMSDDIPPT